MGPTTAQIAKRAGTTGDAPHPVAPARIDWEAAFDRIKNQPLQELWVYPPLVREAMPESEAGGDLWWLAWHGIDAEGQTDLERSMAARVREELSPGECTRTPAKPTA